jgi:signal transduction histidine kinase/tetratricopeptide (TPR) repeat protein
MQMGKSILKHLHNKQLLLFLIALVLPCSVLVVLTWQVIGQQKELTVKRQADERRRTGQEIGRDLLARLEDIKLHEVSASSMGTKSLNTLDYTRPEVILVALTDGNRLWLPWEVDPAVNRMAPWSDDQAQRIRRAEQEEFIHQRWDQADQLYLECLNEASDPAQKAHLRLLRARLLSKSGDSDSSLAHYRQILETDPNITDEHGIAFCLYAMSPLIEKADAFEHVLARIEHRLTTPHWLIPGETYLIRDIIDRLMNAIGAEDSQRETASAMQANILTRIGKQEVALALQKDFPRLALLSPANGSQKSRTPIWLAYGEAPVLISLAPALPGERRLLIAVQGQDMLDTLLAPTPHAKATVVNTAFALGSDHEGQALGSSFPGLSILFSGEIREASWEDGRLQHSFYWVALCVVLCVTLLGAYFLWRDVTRELRLAAMRSQFIASVSHELKTPLTAIRIFSETLRLGRAKDAETRSEYLDTIVHESQRLTRLLNNVLDFSKIEKGKRRYHKEPACLAEIGRAVAETMQYPLMQQGFHLDVSMGDDLPEFCVDRDAMEQALLNLLSNAMKYSGSSREIELRIHRRHDKIIMAVKDRGIGIETSERTRIFEKFHRVASPENERIPGTGLGLALVAHIVEAHCGRIEVQSRPGEGSTFSIYLPLETNHASNSHC